MVDVLFSTRLVVSENKDEEALERQFESSLYFLSAVSAGLWLVWISWIPFLGLLVPEATSAHAVSTISDTFGKYSSVSTIYLVAPSSVLLLLRVYRTYKDPSNNIHCKKKIAVILILCQVLLFVIIRYDSIHGPAHFVCVFLLVAFLLLYHKMVTYVPRVGPGNTSTGSEKLYIALGSFVFLCIFGICVIWGVDPETDAIMYNIACICEIIGVFLLGCLDVVDIGAFAHRKTKYQHSTQLHMHPLLHTGLPNDSME